MVEGAEGTGGLQLLRSTGIDHVATSESEGLTGVPQPVRELQTLSTPGQQKGHSLLGATSPNMDSPHHHVAGRGEGRAAAAS